MIHTVRTSPSGVKEERWSDGKVQVILNAGWKEPLISRETLEEFPRPNWISQRNFKEIKQQGDKQFLIFRARVFASGGNITQDQVGPGMNLDDLKADAVAVIDADTRLPENVETGNQIMTFKFESIQTNPLDIPVEIQTAIAEQQ